jgi:outer membrane immunogenic protein
MKRFALAIALAAVAAAPGSAADLAYKSAPVAAPVPTWQGFYLGAGAGWGQGTAKVTAFGVSESGDGDGFVGGGFAGYNWQGGNVVFGVEAELYGTSIGKTYDDGVLREDTNLDYLGTVRARLGYSFGTVMPYVSGGFAYGGISDTVDVFGVRVLDHEEDRTGWTVGAGIDFALTPAWFARIDYKYVDLGGKDYQVLGVPFKVETDGHFVTAGIGVKF